MQNHTFWCHHMQRFTWLINWHIYSEYCFCIHVKLKNVGFLFILFNTHYKASNTFSGIWIISILLSIVVEERWRYMDHYTHFAILYSILWIKVTSLLVYWSPKMFSFHHRRFKTIHSMLAIQKCNAPYRWWTKKTYN